MENGMIHFNGERYEINLNSGTAVDKVVTNSDIMADVPGCSIELDQDSVYVQIPGKNVKYQFSRNNVRDILREIIYSQ